MARWLAGKAGGSGHVVAIDIEPKWLADAPNIQVLRQDVATDPLGESEYDLISVRLVLTHLPDPQAVVDKLFRALVPGGWLLIEDYDMTTLPTCYPPDATWQKVASAPIELVRMAGADPYLGAKLTGMLHTTGAEDVDTEAIALPRRMPEVRNWQIQFVQLRERLTEHDWCTAEEVDKVIADFDDENCDLVVYGPTLVSALGRKPQLPPIG